MTKTNKSMEEIQEIHRRFLFDPVGRALELSKTPPGREIVMLPLQDLSTTMYVNERDVTKALFHPPKKTRLIAAISSEEEGVLNDRGTLPLLRELGSHATFSAVATDVPFHGAGPWDPIYKKPREALAWRLSYYEYLKQFGFPVVPIVKGGEGALVAELARANPRLLAAMVWIAPTVAPVAPVELPVAALISKRLNEASLLDFLDGLPRR